MSIRHLVYVACDACGDPCGGNDDLRDDAVDARALARSMGWHRVPVVGRVADVCPRHPPGADETREAIRRWSGW